MASSATMEHLQQRANQADEIISQLQAQLSSLKAAAVVKACQDEEEKLRKENEKLRAEVMEWKQRLIQAEVQNGLVQVAIPGSSALGGGNANQKMKTNLSLTQPPAKQTPQQEKKKDKKSEKKGETKAKQAAPPAADSSVDVSRLNMRIGQIVNVKKHPDADSLYVEEVDVGEEKNRTIVSGLVKHVSIEEMQNRKAIFLINLKPAKMRGVMSEGMIMCASSPEKVEIIVPPADVQIGDQVTVEGYTGAPDAMLNPKKKIFEQVQPELRINEQGLASYRGVPWNVAGKGVCKAPTMTNSAIK
jgi:aminoacyl tRNA synthase complex-interacting multifunctional protein 1